MEARLGEVRPAETRPTETRPGAGAVRVPPQARSGGSARQRGMGRGADPRDDAPRDDTSSVDPAAPAAPVEPAARGEHTHSETPIRQPRMTREGVRDPQAPGIRGGAAPREGSPRAGGASAGGASTGGVPTGGASTGVPGTGARGFPNDVRGPGPHDASTAVPGTEGRRTSTAAPGRGGAPESLGVARAPGAPGGLSAPGDLDGPGAPGGRGAPFGRRVPEARKPTAASGSAPAPVSGSAFASAAPRPVIQRASVRGQILDALRSALVAGDLAPGEVYSAPVLGERFGVSATPVREAMQQLANEGAVEVVPNRGFRVIRRGARELAELAEIRALVEMPVMLRLTRTVGAPCWAELRPLADATVDAASTGDQACYAESDRVFHAAILALSGNRQLVQLADDLHRRAQWPLAGTPARRTCADLLADAAQHAAILDALTVPDVPDVPTAQALVREHFAGA